MHLSPDTNKYPIPDFPKVEICSPDENNSEEIKDFVENLKQETSSTNKTAKLSKMISSKLTKRTRKVTPLTMPLPKLVISMEFEPIEDIDTNMESNSNHEEKVNFFNVCKQIFS